MATIAIETEIHQQVDQILKQLLQTKLAVDLTNSGLNQSCHLHHELVEWLQQCIQQSNQAAADYAAKEKQALADQQQAMAAAKSNMRQKTNTTRISHLPSAGQPITPLRTNREESTKTLHPTHAHPYPVEVGDETRIDSAVSQDGAEEPFHPTPVAGARTSELHSTGMRGRRQFPQQLAQPTLVSDVERLGLSDQPLHEIEPSIEIPADEPSGLFGMPKKVDKSKLLSPYLQTTTSSRTKVKTVASTNLKSKSARAAPTASPSSSSIPDPITSRNLSGAPAFSLDAILAQARHVQPLDDDFVAPPIPSSSSSSVSKPTSSSARGPPGRAFIPSAAKTQTAASAAKQRKPTVAAAPDPRAWNSSYNAATKSFADTALAKSFEQIQQQYQQRQQSRKRTTHQPTHSNDESMMSTDVFQVQYPSVSPLSTGEYQYSIPSLRVTRSTALGDSIPYSVLMQHSPPPASSNDYHHLPPPPPPPPPPPTIPAPPRDSEPSHTTPSPHLRFSYEFLTTVQRFYDARERITELNERRVNAWTPSSSSSTAVPWQTAEAAFMRTVSESPEPELSSVEPLMIPSPFDPHQLPPAPYSSFYSFLPDSDSPTSRAFTYPVNTTNLNLMKERLLAENKQRAQAARRSTFGLEPTQAELDQRALVGLKSFELAKLTHLRRRLSYDLESCIGERFRHFFPTKTDTIPTKTLIPLLKLGYRLLSVGGRQGPRNRHGQPRKALPTFLHQSHIPQRLWLSHEENTAKDIEQQPEQRDE